MIAQKPKPKLRGENFLASKNWSEYQKAIFEECANGSTNVCVSAVAGSGKTTSLVGIVANLPTSAKVQILMFNKHTAVEFTQKLINSEITRTHVTVNTAHSYGLSLLHRIFRGSKPTVQSNKYYQICKSLVLNALTGHYEQTFDEPDFPKLRAANQDFTDSFIQSTEQLARLARLTLCPVEIESLIKLANRYNIDFLDKDSGIHWGSKIAIAAIEEGSVQAKDYHLIDYTDMVWLPDFWNLYPKGSKDYLLVDECQDASAALISLYAKFINSGTKVIAVGDPRQAIMAFAGGESDSYDQIVDRFAATELPLSVCYRCPSNHVDLAQRLVSHIQAFEGNPQGEIKNLLFEQVLEMAHPGDLLICRLNGPLIHYCLRLISLNKKAFVRGRDLFKALKKLAVTVHKLAARRMEAFEQVLVQYTASCVAKLEKDGYFQEAESFRDRACALQYCYAEFGKECTTLEEFLERIKQLFIADKRHDEDYSDESQESSVDSSSIITLSTIHRAKGDEAERVFLLDSNNLPFSHKKQPAWQYEQELNLIYVALTRSKKSLFFVPSPTSTLKLPEQLLALPLGGIHFPTPPSTALQEKPQHIEPQNQVKSAGQKFLSGELYATVPIEEDVSLIGYFATFTRDGKQYEGVVECDRGYGSLRAFEVRIETRLYYVPITKVESVSKKITMIQ